MLPLYLNVLLPKSDLLSIYVYFVLFFLIIIFFIDYKNITSRGWCFYFIYLFSSLSLIIVSSLFNQSTYSYSDFSELFRVFFISSSFLYGVSKFDKVNIKSIGLFITVFVFSQAIVSIPQALNFQGLMTFGSLIWSVDKITIGRVVGTMTNPNFLGILASALSIFIIMKSTLVKKITKVEMIQLISLFMLIIFAGSRTSLLSLTLGCLLIVIVNLREHIFKFLIPLCFIFLFGADIYDFLLNYEGLRYISEPLRLYEKNKAIDILQVNALSHRVDIWSGVYQTFINTSGYTKYIFGLGPGKDIGLSFLDNQYLFWFFKYGILGCITFSIPPLFSIYISLRYIINKNKVFISNDIECLCLSFAIVFIINGFFAETFSSMMVGPLFYFIFGLLFGRLISFKN